MCIIFKPNLLANPHDSYDNALGYIADNDLLDKYYNYANKILSKADGIGRGFSDTMYELSH